MQSLVQLLLVVTSAAGLKQPPQYKLRSKSTSASSAFKSLPKHPEFQEAKNVCLQVTDACSTSFIEEGDDDSNKLMAKLNLQPMPDHGSSDWSTRVLESGLLITRSKDLKFDKQHAFFQQHELELSESMLPMFDFVHDLHQKVAGELFSAVVMPQVKSKKEFKEHNYDAEVLDSLLEVTGSKENTKKMFCEDMKKHMVCFNRLIHYRHAHSEERTHLTSAVAAVALREHALVRETKSTGRQAVLVLRKDHHGWVNFVEVEQKLRKALYDKCWNLKTVEPSDTSVQRAIEGMQDADLVVANHGAHNEHMIWMPRGAAFIEDKNCECSTYGYEQLASQEGITYAMTAGTNGDEKECALQKQGLGICTKDKPRVVDFEVEILPTLEKTIQLLEKSRSTPSACNK